jgi:hypothetical protein
VAAVGRWLVGLGLLCLVVGGFLILLGRVAPAGWRVPGDIVWRRPGFTFVFPLGTSLLLSVALTLLLWLWRLLARR